MKRPFCNVGPSPDGTMVRGEKVRPTALYAVRLRGFRKGRRADVVRWLRSNWGSLSGPDVEAVNLANGGGPPTLRDVAAFVDRVPVREVMEEAEVLVTKPVLWESMNDVYFGLEEAGAIVSERTFGDGVSF